MALLRILEPFRRRVVAATTGLFAHADYPLAKTLQHRGDPGLFGPASATWRVIGDPAAFLGGLRALLVQAAHPEVVAGVVDHSRYREDPLGRLSRTSAYITATAYGARPEAEVAVETVRRIHKKVVGTSHRELAYRADEPALASWVHNSLTDGFLTAYRLFGREPLDENEVDRFVTEQTTVGEMLYANELPRTANGLAEWIATHPDLAASPGMAEAVSFLRRPPLRPAVRLGYSALFVAAAATLPPRLRHILGLRKIPGAITVGRATTSFLRWALGSSPSWQLALVRVREPTPPGLFKQSLPLARMRCTPPNGLGE